MNLEQAFCAPSAAHWIGCDAYGVDLLWRILRGALHSAQIAGIVVSLTAVLGLLAGTLIALAPAPLKGLLLRLIDSFLAFPGFLLALLLVSFLPATLSTVIFALVATGWAGKARLVRAIVDQTLTQPFVEAARASGASTPRIIWREVYPALWGQLAVQCALSTSGVIIAEAALSFLGLGGSSGHWSWGALIAEGRSYLVEHPRLSLAPGFAIFGAVLSFQILAEKLRWRYIR